MLIVRDLFVYVAAQTNEEEKSFSVLCLKVVINRGIH